MVSDFFWDFLSRGRPFPLREFVLILQNYLPISVLDVIILLWVGVGKNLGPAQDGLTLSATEIFYFFLFLLNSTFVGAGHYQEQLCAQAAELLLRSHSPTHSLATSGR